MDIKCTHLNQIKEGVEPKTPDGCEECLKEKTPWRELRMCLTCGHIGCCDSSIGRHATKHFKDTNHPIMKSFQKGEEWKWCYIDEELVT